MNPPTTPKIELCNTPGGCEYTVLIEGKWRECGTAATHKLNRARGLLYCDLHADVVRRANPKHPNLVRQLFDYEVAEIGRQKLLQKQTKDTKADPANPSSFASLPSVQSP